MANRLLYFPKLIRRRAYSVFSSYREYKLEIREDCQGRCVYCDLHENELGGMEHMTLDHFRPRSLYTKLEHEPTNLVWSCRICNERKGNVWPAIGTKHTFVIHGGFVDPFMEDLHEYFDVTKEGALIARKHPAKFMIRQMKLNRAGARASRKKRRLEYENREESLQFLAHAIRQLDNALDHPDLPEGLQAALRSQRDEFSRMHDKVLADTRPDFMLR